MKFWAKAKKQPWFAAWVSALGTGLLVHLFGLLTVLQNCDNIAEQPQGYGAGITSGRWLLELLGNLDQWLGLNYNLPLLNGLLFLIQIACAAALFASCFRLKSKKICALVGGLFVVFPAAYATLAFRFTAVYYGYAILFAVGAAWIWDRHSWGPIASAVLIALSMGIYQAYVPFTITMFVLLLLQRLLVGDGDLRWVLRRGCGCVVTLAAGAVLYYGLLQLLLAAYGVQLSAYNGASAMGGLTVERLPSILKEVLYTFCTMPLGNYGGLASRKLIALLYWLSAGLAAVLTGYLLIRRKRTLLQWAAVGALWCIFPVAVNFVTVMSPDAWVYTVMLYPFVLVACVPLILLDGAQNLPFIKAAAYLVAAAMVFGYGYETNVNYMAQYYTNRQVENYVSSLVTQVRMTEGFRADQKWVILGTVEDPLLHGYWEYEMTYLGVDDAEWMLKRPSWIEWVRHYVGYSIPEANPETVAQIAASPEAAAMPCWPDAGSIRIIDDTVVIKFSE